MQLTWTRCVAYSGVGDSIEPARGKRVDLDIIRKRERLGRIIFVTQTRSHTDGPRHKLTAVCSRKSLRFLPDVQETAVFCEPCAIARQLKFGLAFDTIGRLVPVACTISHVMSILQQYVLFI